jgi:hypothetical protein
VSLSPVGNLNNYKTFESDNKFEHSNVLGGANSNYKFSSGRF